MLIISTDVLDYPPQHSFWLCSTLAYTMMPLYSMYIVENIYVTSGKRSRQISSDWKREEQNNMPRLQESREAIFVMKAISTTRSPMKEIEVTNGTLHSLAHYDGLCDFLHKYRNTVSYSNSQSNCMDDASDLDNLQTQRTERNAKRREL